MIKTDRIWQIRQFVRKCKLITEASTASAPDVYYRTRISPLRYFPPEEKVLLIRGFWGSQWLVALHWKNLGWALLVLSLALLAALQQFSVFSPFPKYLFLWPIGLMAMAVIEIDRAWKHRKDFEKHAYVTQGKVLEICVKIDSEGDDNLQMVVQFRDAKGDFYVSIFPLDRMVSNLGVGDKQKVIYDRRMPVVCHARGQESEWSGIIIWLFFLLGGLVLEIFSWYIILGR